MNKLAQVTVRWVPASLLLVLGSPALAQVGQEAVADTPKSASWLAFLLALFLLAVVIGGSLMAPKRTHQD